MQSIHLSAGVRPGRDDVHARARMTFRTIACWPGRGKKVMATDGMFQTDANWSGEQFSSDYEAIHRQGLATPIASAARVRHPQEISMSNLAIGAIVRRSFITALFVFAASASSASAASLFFFKGNSKASSEKICLSFATDQAKRLGLRDVKSDKLSVSGNKNNFTAILT
jgi:hypothetical protein